MELWDRLKHIVVSNWQQKLLSLILAIALWIVLKESLEPGTLDQILSSLGLIR
jgi:hypothetical protein